MKIEVNRRPELINSGLAIRCPSQIMIPSMTQIVKENLVNQVYR